MKSRTWMWMSVVSLFAALALPAQARVVYTPVNVNLPTNGDYAIDLNHDGITDFTFQISHTFYVCNVIRFAYRNTLNVQPTPAGGIVGNWASALQSGVQIDSHQSFYGGDDLMYDVQQSIGGPCRPPHSYGYWVFVQQRYLGLEFQINGETHYGWAELSTDGRYGNAVHYLFGFAYETIPFKGILTGQTMDSPDEPEMYPGSAESRVPGLTAPVAATSSSALQPQSSAAPGKEQIITFDAPGAGTAPFQGTGGLYIDGINPEGAIAGYYIDANNVYHGFLRARDGDFTTFDAPGAGNAPFQGTFAYWLSGGITPAGAIMGEYLDANDVFHGFVRARDGIFTTFDPPGSTQTVPNSINPAGAITGSYFDLNDTYHGFLRASDGTIATFDVPSAGTGPSQGTAGSGINPAGAITGQYTDASSMYHGVLRANDGSFTTFDAPGAGTGPYQGTIGLAINPAGTITGVVLDASNVYHSFLRARDGTITTFDASGAGTGPFQGTIAQSINPAGTIAGYYVDASNVAHGFLRARDGAVTMFDAPGAGTGTGQGTLGLGINPKGAITGSYVDANNVSHGFLRSQ